MDVGIHRNTILSALSSLAGKIGEIEVAIADHHRQIDALNTSLERAKIDYNRFQNELAPISSLPNEILSAIFEAGCAPPSNFSKHPFEILVSHISQRWRYVAISTPRLWTKIALNAPTLHRFDMANIYILRSKASGLNIFVDIARESITLEGIASVCALINPHAERWNRIHVDCDWRQGFHYFLDQLPAAAPHLQYIKFDRSFDEHPDDGDDRFDAESDIPRRIFIDGAPCLNSILVGGVTLHSCLPPLTAVTHLQLDHLFVTVSINRLRTMLTSLSVLTHLAINSDIFVNWAEAGSIDLPSLRSLHLQPQDDGDLIPGLLTTIAAPSLQSLLIETMEPDEALRLAQNILPPRYPSLHFLTLLQLRDRVDRFPLSTWQLFIRALPTVTHFTLSGDDMTTFFESLDEKTNPLDSSFTSPLWPQLHTLTILDQPRQPRIVSNITLIYAAILARIALGHPIRKLQVSKSIMSALIDSLEGLRAHVEVEESTMYPELGCDTFVIN